ncbi:hypothetical protein D3C87_1747670 [compost metagenome]
MLHLTDGEAWRDADRHAEPNDVVSLRPDAFEFGLPEWGNHAFRRKLVSFVLPIDVAGQGIVIDKGVRLVEHEMSDLVENREPELIITLVAETQQQHRLVRVHHSYRATGAASIGCLDYNECHPGLRAQRPQFWKKELRMADHG